MPLGGGARRGSPPQAMNYGAQPFQGSARSCKYLQNCSSGPSFTVIHSQSFFHTCCALRPLGRCCFLYPSMHALQGCTFFLVQPHCQFRVPAPEAGISAHKFHWTRSSKDSSLHSFTLQHISLFKEKSLTFPSTQLIYLVLS